MSGPFAWHDLTVPDAATVRDFYAAVLGWKAEPFEMADRTDWNMHAGGDEPVAGICNATGSIADLPPVWLAYVEVDDLDATLERCIESGGEVVKGASGAARYAVIRDPAGAHLALVEKSSG